MQSKKLLATMVFATAALAAAPIARSDGPCNKGFRDATPAERATQTAVLQAAKRALPSAPAGWVIVGDDQISVTTSLCRDYEAAPWRYEFNRGYQRVDDQEARNKMIADAAAISAAAQKQKQPRLDAIQAKGEVLIKKQIALIEKGDMAGATALNEEMARLQEQSKKIMDEGDSQAQMEALLARASSDQFMYINVRVNANQEVPPADARSIPPPAGARAAFRWDTSQEQVPSENALILVGQWQSIAGGKWKRALHPSMAPTAAQVMSISVTADPDRIAGIISAIDVRTLATKVPN